MNFYEKLIKIQGTLNAPKNQYNKFGKYAYRNCEDILQALKPHLTEHQLFMKITDELVNIDGRYYVKSIVTVTDGEVSESNTAFAREDENKKGMDGAQITGAASSYSRKYCLNGFWGIDDNKDPDTDEHHNVNNNAKSTNNVRITQQQQIEIQTLFEGKGYTLETMLGHWGIKSLGDMMNTDYQNNLNAINSWGNANG